jgi:hypothetical protein
MYPLRFPAAERRYLSSTPRKAFAPSRRSAVPSGDNAIPHRATSFHKPWKRTTSFHAYNKGQLHSTNTTTKTHFLVRAGKSRRVQQDEEEITSSLMRARAFPSQASRPFEGRARHGHQACSTQLQLAFGQMTLLPPRHEPRAGKDPVTVWIIRVWEEQARDAEEPLEWMKFPSVPTTTLEQTWGGSIGIDIAGWLRTIINASQVGVALKNGKGLALTV